MDDLFLQNKECDLSNLFKHLGSKSMQLINLLLKMIEVDPEQRPTAEEALRHPFFGAEQTLIDDLIA